jgi:hypothetical protein
MAFDREAAKQAGYSDAEIDAYLAKQKVPEAPAVTDPYAGMSKREIAQRMTTFPQTQSMPMGSVDDLMRQLGLTARAGITGATSIPAMMADALAGMVNLGTGKQTMMPSSKGLQNLLDYVGLPKPQSAQERVVQDITSGLAGVAGPAAVAGRMAPAAREFFTTNLPAQVGSAAGAAGLSGYAREEDAGPMAQLLASLIGGAGGAGGMVGSTKQMREANIPAAMRTAQEFVRPLTEGGREVITGKVLRSLAREPETAIENIAAFRPTVPGYQPTTAQASRDIGLIAAETPIRGLATGGPFEAQQLQANQARLAIVDRMAKDEEVLKQAIAKRDEVTSPLREQAFAASTVSPETFQSAVSLTVNKTIDDILSSDVGARGTVKKAMQWAKDQLAEGTTPQRMYEVRKDLRDAAQGLLDKEGSAYSLAKGQLEQVIRSVDDAIDAAAPGYKAYLDKYAASSRGIERLEAAQGFKSKVISTIPDPSRAGDFLLSQPAFTRAIRAAEQDTNLSKTQLVMLKKVAEDLDSGVLSRAAKSPGSDTFKNMSFANVIGGIVGKQMFGEVSPALNKVAAPMNWLYNGTDDKIRELLVEAMLDPKLAARLMQKANIMQVESLSKELQRKALSIGYGAAFGLQPD